MATMMSCKYIFTNQVKCNFCFNWIQGMNFVKKQLNICDVCLDNYLQNECQVHTMSGQSYLLSIKKYNTKKLDTNSFIDNLNQSINEGHVQLNSTGRPLLIQQNKNKIIQQLNNIKQTQSQQLQDNKQQSLDNIQQPESKPFIRSRNNTKSQLLNNLTSPQKPSQSCIFNIDRQFQIKQPMSTFKNLKKFNRLQQMGKSLDKTRFISKYKYHFDQNVIRQYTQSNRKIDRQFGNQLQVQQFNLHQDNSQLFNDQSTINKKSVISNQSNKKYLKISEDDIKTKIQILLQDRPLYSETHKRLIATQMKQIYQYTIIENKTLELISYNIANIDFQAYLQMFQFDNISSIKLINVGLTDMHLYILLNFIKDKHVQSIALTGNKLTENCLTMFLNGYLPYLKQIYLGKNPINKSGLKQNIIQLKSKFILYL